MAEHETDIIRFKAQVLLADIKKDPQKRIEAVNSVVQSIAHIADPVSRDVYIQECASILGIQEDTIAKSVARVRGTLVEKWKQDRIKREFPITSESAQTANPAHPSGNGGNMPAGISENTQPLKPLSKIAYSSPMLPLEKVVIEYCLKYGFSRSSAQLSMMTTPRHLFLSLILYQKSLKQTTSLSRSIYLTGYSVFLKI